MCFVKSQLVLVGTMAGRTAGESLREGSEVEGLGCSCSETGGRREEEGSGMEKLWRVKERDPPGHGQSTSAS